MFLNIGICLATYALYHPFDIFFRNLQVSSLSASFHFLSSLSDKDPICWFIMFYEIWIKMIVPNFALVKINVDLQWRKNCLEAPTYRWESSWGLPCFVIFAKDYIFCRMFLFISRRAERSLFAQGHVKMVSFFPVRDIPLHFISLNVFFSAPVGRIYPIFV